jgi:lysophospholipase L1-like esterase
VGDKFATSGWSSWQGLQALRRDIAGLRPSVLTIYFGWNDHWVGFGVEDDEVAEITQSRLRLLPMQSRAAQLLLKTRLA